VNVLINVAFAIVLAVILPLKKAAMAMLVLQSNMVRSLVESCFSVIFPGEQMSEKTTSNETLCDQICSWTAVWCDPSLGKL
jgi:hypothetical protein